MELIGSATAPTGGAATIIVSFPAVLGEMHKVLLRFSTTDLLYRAHELLLLKSNSGVGFNGYGIVGDSIPYELRVVERTGTIDVEIMNYHTSPLFVEVLSGTGLQTAQAFI